MKKLLSLILIPAVVMGCKGKPEKRFGLYLSNGHGWSYTTSYICCDSFSMINTKRAVIYNNGTRSEVEAENFITVNSNQ